MSEHYLLFRDAGIEYLLAMHHVVEVGLVPEDSSENTRHRAWRDRVLPVHRLAAARAAAPLAHQVVVHGGDDMALLDVDEILGLVQVGEADWRAFAPTAAGTAQCVDRALPRPGGRCALRLRWPQALTAGA